MYVMMDYTYLGDKNKQVLLERSNNTVELVLLQRISFEDRDAFHEIFTRYYPRLHDFISRLIKSQNKIDEITNEIMFVVWHKAYRFKGRLRVSNWIFRIAYKKALQSFLNQASYPSASAEDLNNKNNATYNNDEFNLSENQHAIAQLSFEHHAVVLLTYVYGYSYTEISAIMCCPIHTVKTRMSHARIKLQESLAQLETEYETVSRS